MAVSRIGPGSASSAAAAAAQPLADWRRLPRSVNTGDMSSYGSAANTFAPCFLFLGLEDNSRSCWVGQSGAQHRGVV